jgi:cytidine deaminase
MRKLTFLIIFFSLWIIPSQASDENYNSEGINPSKRGNLNIEVYVVKPLEIPCKNSLSVPIVGNASSSSPNSARSDTSMSDLSNSIGSDADVRPSNTAGSPSKLILAKDLHQRTQKHRIKLSTSTDQSEGSDFDELLEKQYQQILTLQRKPQHFDLSPQELEGIRLALEATKHSKCHISKYRVGCAVYVNDMFVQGCNVEGPSNLRECLCSERTAYYPSQQLTKNGGKPLNIEFTAVFAVSPITGLIETFISSPCGQCRGVHSLNTGARNTIYCHGSYLWKQSIEELLKYPNAPIIIDSALENDTQILSPEKHVEFLCSLPKVFSAQLKIADGESFDLETIKLLLQAVKGAQIAAYSPYHPVREGAALMVESNLLKSGKKIFWAGNTQNAAFGASNEAGVIVFEMARQKLAKRRAKVAKSSTTLEETQYLAFALVAFDKSDKLITSKHSPTGLLRQVAAEIKGWRSIKSYFPYNEKFVCEEMGNLLFNAFSFIEITSQSLGSITQSQEIK